jgi:hypothetical protein
MALKFFGGDNNNSKFNKIDYLDSKWKNLLSSIETKIWILGEKPRKPILNRR